MSDDIVAFIRARLDEDERVARAATSGAWRWIDPGGRVKQALVAGDAMVLPSATGDVYPSSMDAAHIARYDPARVLREVEAKRALLAACVEYDDCPAGMSGSGLAYHVEEQLALPYADHPDYREYWRP